MQSIMKSRQLFAIMFGIVYNRIRMIPNMRRPLRLSSFLLFLRCGENNARQTALTRAACNHFNNQLKGLSYDDLRYC